MSSNITNQVPFLRTSRSFPMEAQPLSVEINKSYVDIANSVNARTIGQFTTNRPVPSGESWFLRNQRQQGLRQAWEFTGSNLSINHGINISFIYAFTKIYGTFTDGTNWYPLPYVDTTDVINQVSVEVTPTQIVITAGGGAPTISTGIVVLEWISNV